MRLHLGRGGGGGGLKLLFLSMSFSWKKKWNKKKEGEGGRKRRFIRSRVSFHLRPNLHPPFLFCNVENLERYLAPKRWYERQRERERKKEGERRVFRRFGGSAHARGETLTFVEEVWTVTAGGSPWLRASGGARSGGVGGIPTAFWFSTAKKTWSTPGSGTIYHRSVALLLAST